MKDPRTSLIILLVLALTYAGIVLAHLSEAYIDFGDGNYLYISSRLADRLVLYRDIMAPQPPCHLYLGSLLVRLGRLLGEPLYTVRIFGLLLHLASMLLIFLIARRLFRSEASGVISSALYLIIPIGFYWSLGYQSEPLEMLFLLLSFYFFIKLEQRAMVLAAVLAAFAVFTNMTAAPYILLNIIYLLLRRRNLVLSYLIPFVVLCALGVLLMQLLTGEYLNNVFFNQVGTFPKKEISGETVWHYAVRKILGEGRDVLAAEGAFILLAIIGMVWFFKFSTGAVREYAVLYALASLGSIVFVSKGGTEDYIFTIAEPFVALFAGYAIIELFTYVRRSHSGSPLTPSLERNIAALCIVLLSLLTLLNLLIALRYFFELSDASVKHVKLYIDAHTKPGDAILAQPYLAFVSGRTLTEEYSEHFIWKIMYWNEKRVMKRDGAAVALFERLAARLSHKEIPLVILDLEQTATIPPVREAIIANYKSLLDRDIRSRSFTFRLLIPR
jgi:hypothetical protein